MHINALQQKEKLVSGIWQSSFFKINPLENKIELFDGSQILVEGRGGSCRLKEVSGNEINLPRAFVNVDKNAKNLLGHFVVAELPNDIRVTAKAVQFLQNPIYTSQEFFVTHPTETRSVRIHGLDTPRPKIDDLILHRSEVEQLQMAPKVLLKAGSDGKLPETTRKFEPILPAKILDVGTVGDPHEPNRVKLPADYGAKPGEKINSKLEELEHAMTQYLKEYEKKAASTRNQSERQHYNNVIKAVGSDLQEVRKNKSLKKNKDKIFFFNRMSYEFHLEVKYNVNLTGKNKFWSENDLAALDSVLANLPDRFHLLDPKMQRIQLEDQKKGVGAYNNGQGLISLGSKAIQTSLIHEVGHNFDDENPQWKEFQALSGWKNVTQQFSEISGDYKDEVYLPYSGSAKFKQDGKIYRDGSAIDLDGDGTNDHIVQVHYDRVMVYRPDAHFISSYARTSPKEDFAETFEMYLTNKESAKELQALSSEKYEFMRKFTGMEPRDQKPVGTIRIMI